MILPPLVFHALAYFENNTENMFYNVDTTAQCYKTFSFVFYELL